MDTRIYSSVDFNLSYQTCPQFTKLPTAEGIWQMDLSEFAGTITKFGILIGT